MLVESQTNEWRTAGSTFRRYLLEIIGGGWLWYKELDKSRGPSASADNTFQDQHDSSYHEEAEDNIIVLSLIQNPVLQALGDSLIKEPNIDCRWNLVHWCYKSKRWQKSNKKWGSPCLFWRHNADKYGYFGPFDKNRAQPKTRQKGKIFSMMHVVSHRIWL